MGGSSRIERADRFDAVVVGASIAGCSTAIGLARAGARVALVEKRPDPEAFKRVCGHFIQSSGVPAIERLGLLEPLMTAGAVRSRTRIVTRWGAIEPPPADALAPSLNIRRERLDPLLRATAAAQDGVELMLGETVTGLLRADDGTVGGVETADRSGRIRRLAARLTVGADGRDSRVGELAEVPRRTWPHARFSYGAYFEGAGPENAPDGTVWLLDPDWAAAFPTDSGLTLYAVMPRKEKLPAFRQDPAGALREFVAALPEAPPILASRQVGSMVGKLEMPNVRRGPVAPGLAFVGDAALATDPLWGVGCGWAFQSAEWLADAVAPALAGEGTLTGALRRYRRTWRRRLAGHAFLIHDYANGRRLTPPERLIYSAAPHDEGLALRMNRYGTRNAGAHTVLSPALLARAATVHARRRRPTLPWPYSSPVPPV